MICAHSWIECSERGTRRWIILMAGGKGYASAGQPSSSMVMGILAVIEADILLPAQIIVSPMGCRSVVRSVATFLPMTNGQVARPLWESNASSSSQLLNLSVACFREALAVVPKALSSFRICV